jgi:hypothetical protein
MNYFVWSPSNKVPNSVAVDVLKGFEKVDRFWRGESLGEDFPKDATFRMRSEFPKNTVLTDSLSNLDSLIVGSERLRDFFVAQDVSHLENYAVEIRDHKNKPVKNKYYIINPISNVDCLDPAASGATMSRIKPTKVQFIKKLVLREDAVDPARKIFRITNFDMIVIVREDLAAAMDKEGFTGVRWVESSKYPR